MGDSGRERRKVRESEETGVMTGRGKEGGM